jgi:hypothetical protein
MRFLAIASQIILQLRAQRRGPLTPTLSPRGGEREEFGEREELSAHVA